MLRGLEGFVGWVLAAVLGAFILMFVVGPFALAFRYFQEGDFPRAVLVMVLVCSYTILGTRAVLRQELGPGVFFAALAILAMIAWAASRLLF